MLRLVAVQVPSILLSHRTSSCISGARCYRGTRPLLRSYPISRGGWRTTPLTLGHVTWGEGGPPLPLTEFFTLSWGGLEDYPPEKGERPGGARKRTGLRQGYPHS